MNYISKSSLVISKIETWNLEHNIIFRITLTTTNI